MHISGCGEKGIPYYCAHCSVMWEILPLEISGYPKRINIIGHKPTGPCIYLYYKNPKLIPTESIVRVKEPET